MAKKTFYTDIDLNGNQLINSSLERLANHPENPNIGQIYFNSTEKTVYFFNGTKWVLTETPETLDIIVDPKITESRPGEKLYKTAPEAVSNATIGNRIIFREGNHSVTDLSENWAKLGVRYFFEQGAIVDLQVQCAVFNFTEINIFDNSLISITGNPSFIYSGPVLTVETHINGFYPIYIRNQNQLIVDISVDYIFSPLGIYLRGTVLNSRVSINRIRMEGWIAYAGVTYALANINTEISQSDLTVGRIEMIAKSVDGGFTGGHVSAIEVKSLSDNVIDGRNHVNVNLGSLYCYDDSTGWGFRAIAYRYSDNRIPDTDNKVHFNIDNIVVNSSNITTHSYMLYVSDHIHGTVDFNVGSMDLTGHVSPIYFRDSVYGSPKITYNINTLRCQSHIANVVLNYDSECIINIKDGNLYGNNSEASFWITGDNTKSNKFKFTGLVNNTTPNALGIYVTNPIKRIEFIDAIVLTPNSTEISSIQSGSLQNIYILNTLTLDKPLSTNIKQKTRGLLIKLYEGEYNIFTVKPEDIIDETVNLTHELSDINPEIFIYDNNGDMVENSGMVEIIDRNNIKILSGDIIDDWKIIVFIPNDVQIFNATQDDMVGNKLILEHQLDSEYPMPIVYNDENEYINLFGAYQVIDSNTVELELFEIFGTLKIKLFTVLDPFEYTLNQDDPNLTIDDGIVITHNMYKQVPIVMLFNEENKLETPIGMVKCIDESSVKIMVDSNMLSNGDWKLFIF